MSSFSFAISLVPRQGPSTTLDPASPRFAPPFHTPRHPTSTRPTKLRCSDTKSRRSYIAVIVTSRSWNGLPPGQNGPIVSALGVSRRCLGVAQRSGAGRYVTVRPQPCKRPFLPTFAPLPPPAWQRRVRRRFGHSVAKAVLQLLEMYTVGCKHVSIVSMTAN